MTVSRRMSFIRISRRSGRGRSRQSQQNDINQQMRVISHELKPDEMHAVAVYYGVADSHE